MIAVDTSVVVAGFAAVSGGSVFDALIAATVLRAKARLLTRDRRAASAYRAIGVDFDLLA